MVVKFNNELYSVFSMTHRTPGNLRGFVQARMRSLRSGSIAAHGFTLIWPCFHAALNAAESVLKSTFTVDGARPSDCR